MMDNIRDWVDDTTHHQTDDELPGHLEQGERFIQSVAVPAFEEVRQQLERDGNKVSIMANNSTGILRVERGGDEVFAYRVWTQFTEHGPFPLFESRGIHGRQSPAGAGHLRPDIPENQGYNATHITKDELVQHILTAYRTETENTDGAR